MNYKLQRLLHEGFSMGTLEKLSNGQLNLLYGKIMEQKGSVRIPSDKAEARHQPQYSGDAKTGHFELPTDGGVLNPSVLFPNELQTAKVDVPLGTYTRKISDAPLDIKNLSGFKGTLSELTEQVAKEFNLDPVKFQSVIQLESVFRPEDAKVKRCMGLGQFALTTFEEVITRNKLTEKYPDVVWARTNPVAATIATAYHTVENLEAVAGKKESYTDLDYAHAYIYHNLGATGGKRMIADLKKDSLDGTTIDIVRHSGATTNPKIYKTEDKSRYLKYGELEDHLLKLLADEYELYKNNPSAQQEVDPDKKYKSEIKPDVVSNDAPENKIPAAVLAQARAAAPNSPEYKPGPANPSNLPQPQQATSIGASLA
jgi:hypothetical protein